MVPLERRMADVFISYVEADSAVAAAIAPSEGLEHAGYTTWCVAEILPRIVRELRMLRVVASPVPGSVIRILLDSFVSHFDGSSLLINSPML
jgi:hypothetical protein